MSAAWPMVPFRNFLKLNLRPYQLGPVEDARLVGMRWYGEGPFFREHKPGINIRKKSHFLIREGDVIYNKLFAWKGSFGLVPTELDGMLVSDKFPTHHIDETLIEPDFLKRYFRHPPLWQQADATSKGAAAISKHTLNPPDFLKLTIPLPDVAEQRRVVARVDAVAARVADARRLQQESEDELAQLLLGQFCQLTASCPRRPMGSVAPLVRRKVEVDVEAGYPELGIRSFAKGTFHKPPLSGAEVGTKKLFEIHPGDLVFNNVFAWEGAVAVARPEDAGRFGSHRFITCRASEGVATARFLFFHFQTGEGLNQLRDASPGGAGRNRTLGLAALNRIPVPVPPIEDQRRFDALQARADALRGLQAAAAAELGALLPAVLARAFAGDQ